MIRKIAVILFACFLMIGCNRQPSPEPDPEPILESVTLSDEEIWLLDKEEPYALSYVLEPADYEPKEIKWMSSAGEIVSVEEGTISPLQDGQATITLEIDGKQASCFVTVYHTDYIAEPIRFDESDGCHYIEGLLIANKTYALPEGYDPGDILDEVMTHFNAMVKAAKKDGVDLWILSGYRSFSKQKRIYNRYVEQHGQKEADTYSARPGHSEHQTGLAMDVNKISYTFNETKEGKWLWQHCTDYGFIIRYPQGKQEQTGYIYEPWHIRFVGTKWAKRIEASGLCVEEFFGIDSVYEEDR